MKKLLAFAVVLCCAITCLAFVGCGSEEATVKIDDITIVDPPSNEIVAGTKFTLDCVILPEEVAEKVSVDWEISDTKRLTYSNGQFTAQAFGTVKVKATVKGNEIYDEIVLTVLPPVGYSEYTSTGYQLAYPQYWTHSNLGGGIHQWAASNGTTSMNIVTEEYNSAYMSASASDFQSSFKAMYEYLGYTVNFKQPVKLEKDNHLGFTRIQVTSIYSLTYGTNTSNIHQAQMIFNNSEANMSCVLTVTFAEEDFDSAAEKIQQQIFSQFIPA